MTYSSLLRPHCLKYVDAVSQGIIIYGVQILKAHRTTIAIVVLMLCAAASEFAMGRRLWGTSGTPGFWSGDINSSHNSQYLLDPYSLTHVTHGISFYLVLSLVARRLPLGPRLVTAVALESGWEVLENTDMVIQRYRTETISLSYFGDSIVNSMSDILCCILGFTLASRLPKRAVILTVILSELLLLLLVRDNLTLNIIMLIHPSRAIKLWQAGA
jgi:hypothetical protein